MSCFTYKIMHIPAIIATATHGITFFAYHPMGRRSVRSSVRPAHEPMSSRLPAICAVYAVATQYVEFVEPCPIVFTTG
mgnify:CR=1 FL=1